MKRKTALLLCILMAFSALSGCSRPKSSNANLSFSTAEKQHTILFQNQDDSEIIHAEHESVAAYSDLISSFSLEYPYADLYGVEACYDRIFTDSGVDSHVYSALDENGALTAEHLREIVKENNQKFYAEDNTNKSFFKETDDAFLLSICTLIVDTIHEVQARYPDIDYDRVYCNLGNLKVFYKTGLLDYAQVTVDMKLLLSDSMLQFVSIMAGGTGIRDVVIHEIMHIVQLGCSCENIGNCTRRVGITYRWDDVDLQGNDWAWFFEGAAELNMCMLTGDDPVTYRNMINYIQSVNLVTFLNGSISANYAQTISFYSDPNKLFDLFHAQSRSEITEIANLMEAIQIMQYTPDEFLSAYGEKYAVDTTQTEVLDQLRYALKPAICLTFAKSFYKNLAYAIADNKTVTANDLFYLIRVFEAAMDYHLTYTIAEKAEVNQPFLDVYKEIRRAFFAMLAENGASVIEKSYLEYDMFSDGASTKANASFKWLESDKREFLLERTEFLTQQLEHKIS